MKKLLRIMSAFLAILAVVSCFSVAALATEAETETELLPQSKEISIINYNVCGLPDFNVLLGKEGRNVKDNQLQLGKILNERDYDIIATQEDFGYHKFLMEGLTDYKYNTNHTGMIPGGDGMNIHSKYPIYNETRIRWRKAFGVIAEGADEMTPKGILYAVIELEDGVYIDFYDIHADVFDGEGSRSAREDNYKQLAAMIMSNRVENNRPVVVVGDFNTYSSSPDEVSSNINYYFHDVCKLKDAWTEICNNGDYEDFSAWWPTGGNWGRWNSVEKVLYKSGGGVELEAVSFEYEYIKNAAGESISDHAAAIAKLKYTKTEDFVENKEELTVETRSPFKNIFNMIKCVFEDLTKIFQNFDQLLEFLNQ